MPNYSNSKIYKLIDNNTGNIYIGSTTQTLYQRKAEHVSDYKKYLIGKHHYVSSFEIVKNGNFDIVLLEKYSCEDKSQLHIREGQYVRLNDCVNKLIPGRTKAQYRKENKEEIKIYAKKYQENNKNKRNEPHECECGNYFTLNSKARHMKSQLHVKKMQSKLENKMSVCELPK